MLSFICFMCPGIIFFPITYDVKWLIHLFTGLFNSVNGLGGGGQLDETTSANANTALYATFSVCAFFAGYVLNVTLAS